MASLAAARFHLHPVVAPVGIVLGLLDYAWQRRRIAKQLKMTKQEVKDEMKQSEDT